jgi:hypothetical protein
MANHSRKFHLEPLEERQLLSHSPALAPGDVSLVDKPKSASAVGSIVGTWFVPDYWTGSGNLAVLGSVQFEMKIPQYGGYTAHRGTLTLTTSTGTLTFGVVEKGSLGPHHPAELTVQGGTNAYAGWTGTGTVTPSLIPGPAHYSREFPDENSFKLKLKV